MQRLETFSKRAAIAMLLAVTSLQLALHPDITPGLQAIAIVALAAGWLIATPAVHAAWLTLAPLAPALMLVAASRQGPIADIVWTAGLTGSLLRVLSWSRWNLPPLWAALLGGWAMVLSFSWPVLIAREMAFDTQSLRHPSGATSWAMMSAPQVVAWTLYVVQTQLLGLLWFDWATGALAGAAARIPRPIHALWVGVTIASVVALVQGTADITFLNIAFWVDAMRATGTMLDANAYGVAAALAGPVGFVAIGRSTGWRIAGSVVVLAVNWSGVWMSSSRTGFLCALLGAAGLVVGLAQTPRRVMTRGRRLMLAGAAAAVALVVVFGGVIGPLQRVAAMPLNIEELWARGGYGTIADRMVRDYPLIGVGVGAYRYLAPDYWREIFNAQLQLDNAQNWWRHQAAELGLAGGSLVVLWSLIVAWQLVGGAVVKRDALRAWMVRGLLAGLAAISLVGVPTQNPVVLLWFYFLVAWLSVLTPARLTGAAHPGIRTAIWTAAVVLTGVYVGGHLLAARGTLAVAERAERFQREYVIGAYPPEPLPDGSEFRWIDDEARFILPARSDAVLIRLWAHHPDIAAQPVTFTISSPCGQVIQRELTTPEPVVVGIVVPHGVGAIDASIRVSRTWQPAEQGGTDTRRLGVGVGTDFVERELGLTRDYVVFWPRC